MKSFRPIQKKIIYLLSVQLTISLLVESSLLVADAAGYRDEDDEAGQRRAAARRLAKPWYSRNIAIGDTSIPISPATLIVLFLSVFYFVYSWSSGPKSFCEASHILVKDEATCLKLKKEIEDGAKFADLAKEHSTCPSGTVHIC